MATRGAAESAVIDRLNRQILHGLQLVPRAPFARLGAVLGVSEQLSRATVVVNMAATPSDSA